MNGIINYLNQIDTNIFLYFNGLHNHYWDYFMTMYSDRFVWIPFYASFLYVMLRNFHIKETVTCLLVIVAIIFICDQTASTLLKRRWCMSYSGIAVADMDFRPPTQPTPGVWHSLQCFW